ncbi:hypothetical protein GE21DRAFT_3177 [Neurospora crassa]|uniref:Uncharacterized protein n=2 Tax=Neurospora crassa TaxID=5141 RepID=Q1K575_NEUCR|nr:hypothetical protein NCU01834 [Neurospora crassa OR74A]EAA27382.1 hypothetical protein NCU01834 [Neurospora crassa OR74A]KHE85623.1 hypothetical protein GE21DRAFT_3177 [Neurospora crassa]CAD70475.1 hypothetical protein [Neurospora crassa]|eukprot:XP_956618.1 hypothetical protein NCU01834 [Neurospora crassa OR74A]
MSVSYVMAHSIGRNAMTARSLERKRVRRCVDLGGCLWPWRSRTNGGYWIRTSRSGSLPSAGSRSALWVPVSRRHPPSRLPQPDKVHRTLPRLALCPTIVQLSLRTRTTAGCYWLASRCRTISGMRVRSPPNFCSTPSVLHPSPAVGPFEVPQGERERERAVDNRTGRSTLSTISSSLDRHPRRESFHVPKLCRRRRRRRWAGAGMPFVRRTRQTG